MSANIKTYRERMQDQGRSWYKSDEPQDLCKDAEIADLRAALAAKTEVVAKEVVPVPVAWKYRAMAGGNDWRVTLNEDWARSLNGNDVEALGRIVPTATVAPAGWISVEDRLPEVGVGVMVYSPPTPDDHPGEVNIQFDCLDPDSDGELWLNWWNNYEHFLMCAPPGGTGPKSEKAPYTHWMPIPDAPGAAPAVQQGGEAVGYEWPKCKACGGGLWKCMACHPAAAHPVMDDKSGETCLTCSVHIGEKHKADCIYEGTAAEGFLGKGASGARKLVRYDDCKCILSQYCDGTCNPIWADQIAAAKGETNG